MRWAWALSLCSAQSLCPSVIESPGVVGLRALARALRAAGCGWLGQVHGEEQEGQQVQVKGEGL